MKKNRKPNTVTNLDRRILRNLEMNGGRLVIDSELMWEMVDAKYGSRENFRAAVARDIDAALKSRTAPVDE